VVIAGAGPAGSATALLLARRGLRVLLVDRAEFPRDKPCGDCVSPGANRLLRGWGLWDAVLARSPALIDGWAIRCGGHGFASRFPATDGARPRSVALPRRELDDVLRSAALDAGAVPVLADVLDVLYDGRRVTGLLCRTSAGTTTLRARLVIGADGLRSRVARRVGAAGPAGPLRKLSLTAHVRGVRPALVRGEMHVAPGLCIGIAPVGGGADPVHNLTVVGDARRFGRDVAADPARFVDRALRDVDHGAADSPAARLRDARPAVPAPARGPRHPRFGALLASGPFDRPTRAVTGPGWALVGDAAGYYDPFTGQGVHAALAGAELLAACAADALERADAQPLHGYARTARRRTRSARRLQWLVESFVARPALLAGVSERLDRAPAFLQGLLAATGDLAAPASILRPERLAQLVLPPRRGDADGHDR